VHIEWIELVSYRNYRSLSYSPGPSLNLLRGRNAQGKTNLLEALGLLLAGRSFRGARPGDLLQWDAIEARVAGALARAEATRALRWTIGPREDGACAVSGERCAWARVIAFGWTDLALLNGAPGARRAFLDGFAAKLSPAHQARQARYRQVLARRNALLQMVGAPGAALEPWDEQLARLGVEMIRRRRECLAVLEGEVEGLHARLGGHGRVALRYESSLPEGAGEAEFAAALLARRRDEARRGQTLVGPHRDDLRIELDGRDMRVLGSRGQQRLLALALRLAEARPVAAAVGSAPVLLLDDALSELDAGAQAAVINELAGLGQVFLTSAETSVPAADAQRWEVEDGRLHVMEREPAWGAA
jgi:DNA replication and repair protein RecF